MSNDYLAISAVVIALLSLGTALWLAHEDRQHNMLRVKPLLDFRVKTQAGKPVVLVLRNLGVGPAVIRRFNLMLDDSPYDINLEGVAQKFLSDLGVEARSAVWTSSAIPPGTLLPAGESMSVVEISDSVNEEVLNNIFESNKRRINVDGAYECIYGSEFEMRS